MDDYEELRGLSLLTCFKNMGQSQRQAMLNEKCCKLRIFGMALPAHATEVTKHTTLVGKVLASKSFFVLCTSVVGRILTTRFVLRSEAKKRAVWIGAGLRNHLKHIAGS